MDDTPICGICGTPLRWNNATLPDGTPAYTPHWDCPETFDHPADHDERGEV